MFEIDSAFFDKQPHRLYTEREIMAVMREWNIYYNDYYVKPQQEPSEREFCIANRIIWIYWDMSAGKYQNLSPDALDEITTTFIHVYSNSPTFADKCRHAHEVREGATNIINTCYANF